MKISHLECDSRRVLPGSCYIALKGTQADGHEFIPEAIRRGACAVVAEMPCTKEARDAGVSWVEVNDSRPGRQPDGRGLERPSLPAT